MADFTTWNRATLEQFAREATAKLIENKAAIEELREALTNLSAEFVKVFPIYYYSEPWAHERNSDLLAARAAITKHESTAKEQ